MPTSKNKSKWSEKQIERASILFELYPDIEKDYNLAQDLKNIFKKTTDKIIGLSRLARWHKKVNQSWFKWIKSKTCGEILNFDICILKIDTNARFF